MNDEHVKDVAALLKTMSLPSLQAALSIVYRLSSQKTTTLVQDSVTKSHTPLVLSGTWRAAHSHPW